MSIGAGVPQQVDVEKGVKIAVKAISMAWKTPLKNRRRKLSWEISDWDCLGVGLFESATVSGSACLGTGTISEGPLFDSRRSWPTATPPNTTTIMGGTKQSLPLVDIVVK